MGTILLCLVMSMGSTLFCLRTALFGSIKSTLLSIANLRTLANIRSTRLACDPFWLLCLVATVRSIIQPKLAHHEGCHATHHHHSDKDNHHGRSKNESPDICWDVLVTQNLNSQGERDSATQTAKPQKDLMFLRYLASFLVRGLAIEVVSVSDEEDVCS